MIIEVPLDLTLGLGHEPQTGAIAHQRGGRADGEGSGVPERIEETRPGGELLQARLAPREVIGFGARRGHQHVARRGGAGDESLTVIQRLRGQLTGVVDAHERRAGTPFRSRQGVERLVRTARDGPGCPGRRKDGSQSTVKGGDGRVEKATGLHI